MGASKASSIEMTSKELQQAHVRRQEVMGCLLSLQQCGFVAGSKLFLDVKRIRVSSGISSA